MSEHRQSAIGTARPLLNRPVPVKLHAVSVRVAEIDGLTDAMIRRAFERNLCFKEAAHSVRQFRPCRIQDRDMVEARRPGWRRLAARALPSVQADVMVITT